MKKHTRLLSILLSLALLAGGYLLFGDAIFVPADTTPPPAAAATQPNTAASPAVTAQTVPTATPAATQQFAATPAPTAAFVPPARDGYYYDLQNVVDYLQAYGQLPENYLTKAQARALGWEGGSVQDYISYGAIGGDTFGNREGLLPEAQGRTYTECDLDTDGRDSRGGKRLVFSSDGLYFYTADHYESFTQVYPSGGDTP